jgi:Uma2 family endonuclease
MATSTTTPKTAPAPAPIPTQIGPGDQCVEMPDIGWEGYEMVLQLRGDRSLPKMIYLDGDLFLVSPALTHERLNRRIGFLVDQLILGLRLPCLQSGQTTFRRQGKRGGVEGDHTYYLANEPRVRGKMQIDLRNDPPPDLAIEVVNTHKADTALKVYRRIGVPEIWVCEEDRFLILVRQKNGRYVEASSGLAFPFLTSAEIGAWMQRPFTGPDVDWMEEVHRWVIEVLVPRVRAIVEQEPIAARGRGSIPIGREEAIVLATRLVEKKHQLGVILRSVSEEEKRWVISFLFDPPPAGRLKGDIIVVYKKTGVARSIGLR